MTLDDERIITINEMVGFNQINGIEIAECWVLHVCSASKFYEAQNRADDIRHAIYPQFNGSLFTFVTESAD